MQNIQELTKEKMDIMKELAATSVKISEAKNVIFKLQEDEATYLEEREKKAMVKIAKVLDDSKDLLAKTHENYDEIHSICQSVTRITDFVSETYGKISGLLEEFTKRSDAWDIEVERQEREFAEIKRKIIIDQTIIANDKEAIKKANEGIEKAKALIESRQKQIKSALLVLEKKQNG